MRRVQAFCAAIELLEQAKGSNEGLRSYERQEIRIASFRGRQSADGSEGVI
jgi:hypothetical protein